MCGASKNFVDRLATARAREYPLVTAITNRDHHAQQHESTHFIKDVVTCR